MSRAMFHDTITLYLPSLSGTGYCRRIVSAVKVIETTATVTEGSRATIYIPLWGRRALPYQPKNWNEQHGCFTVRPEDYLVCRQETADTPPDDALTVRSVICRKSGSRRLWHLEIHADNIIQEVSFYAGTDS